MKLSILAIVAIAATALCGLRGNRECVASRLCRHCPTANRSRPRCSGNVLQTDGRRGRGSPSGLRQQLVKSALPCGREKILSIHEQERRLAHSHSLGDAVYDETVAGRARIYPQTGRRLVQRQSGVVLLLVAWGFRPVWRNVRRGRGLVRQDRDRPNARSVYLSRYVVDRLLGADLPRRGNHSRNQLTEGAALQVSQLGARELSS
jgi:hypothetical protein